MLEQLRHKAVASGTGVIEVTVEQLNYIHYAHEATIADLQGQIAVERANKESAVACVDRDVKKISALQQRVAQLEAERDAAQRHNEILEEANKTAHERVAQLEGVAYIGDHHFPDATWKARCAELVSDLRTLQADHARVLGLVQAATKLLTELTIIPIGCSREQELAWKKAVKDLRAASLPAQPAQRGASKPVTTCNRHSDCDAADEKARAKGALHADHCHDDCCSKCFGN